MSRVKLAGLSEGRAVVAALCAAQFMLILDVVVIYVALPSITRDLGVPGSQMHLVGVTYTVAFGSLLVVFGRVGDLVGRRRILLTGLLLFTGASLGAGVAQTTWHLFAARAAQGIGAAMVSSNALAAINDRFAEGQERNAALGLWAMVGSAGAIAGQLVGGVVTEFVGWRWIFWINIPVGVVVIATLRTRLRESTGGRGGVDVAGSLTLTLALAGIVVALVNLGGSQHLRLAALLLIAAAVLLGLFAYLERRAADPILRLELLRLPGPRTANVTLFLNAGGLGATLFFVTLYLQDVLDYSPLAVALVFAPVTLVIMILSPRAAELTGRVGVRRVLTPGLGLLAIGMLLLARVPQPGGLVDVLPGMLLLAIGSSLAYAPTFIAAATQVPDGDHGAASGFINSMQELGAAACLALLAFLATLAGTTNDTTAGYRAGLLGAAGLLLIASVVALTTPSALGRTRTPPHDRLDRASS